MAWIRCPVAGARKLAQTGKVILGWSIAKVIAIPRRPLQCFSAWNWDTYGLRACPPWTEDTCVTGAAKSDIVPEVVLPRHPSALCASHSGLPPTTGWVGWHVPPPQNQEAPTRPRASGGGKNARQHRRSSRRWPGGGHGVGPMNSRGSSKITWEGRDGRKTCSSRLSGRARSPSR